MEPADSRSEIGKIRIDGQEAVILIYIHGRIGILSNYIDPGQAFGTFPYQDVGYGLGFFDLDKPRGIPQVPHFGDGL